MESKFTRKEVCDLTGLTGDQVDYLCRRGVVVPEKIGDLRRPTVLYTWIQLIEVKIISKLKMIGVKHREACSILEAIRDKNYKLLIKYEKRESLAIKNLEFELMVAAKTYNIPMNVGNEFDNLTSESQDDRVLVSAVAR